MARTPLGVFLVDARNTKERAPHTAKKGYPLLAFLFISRYSAVFLERAFQLNRFRFVKHGLFLRFCPQEVASL